MICRQWKNVFKKGGGEMKRRNPTEIAVAKIETLARHKAFYSLLQLIAAAKTQQEIA
jgi:hypothetical protein